ncbi:MAG TPA: amidase family protein, partial [Thermomicrobiales bacterium]|nr:amidase family protein [Thermomicrobiales bacterium]
NDIGGSLRNPGNFNSVVGFRPTPGLVPKCPSTQPWLPLSVKGPIARSVSDVAFFLSALAGYSTCDQLSFDIDASAFAGDLGIETKALRVAWCPDLGGLPLDPQVRKVIESTRPAFAALGIDLVEAAPDFTDADQIFKDLRAFSLTGMEPVLREHRDLMKPEAIWNIEEGLKLSARDVAVAMGKQAELFMRVRTFMQTYDAYVCAVNQVPPFPVDTPWPKVIDGVQMETYIDWMKSAYFVTATRAPAISVPAGFTDDGLPVGIQIVGKYRSDLALLKLANAVEQAIALPNNRPPIVR